VTFRLSELYPSIQGEGPRVGTLTTFVRFAGCNLKCPLWPCDSQYAIDASKYRSEWTKVDPPELLNEISSTTPRWGNVCLTGGEPWLQPNNDLAILTGDLAQQGYTIECFSNATLEIPDWAFQGQIQFVFDWKLPGSGEMTFNPEIVRRNLHRGLINGCANIKFTVACWEDIGVAFDRLENLFLDIRPEMGSMDRLPDVYMGVVWGTLEEQELAQYLIETDRLGVRLNMQTHKHIWNPEDRGI
jgi:7-carboxy-7-deazaguanine synthase